MSDLRDLARNPAQRDYVRAAAATVADAIEQAAADVTNGLKHRCQRCNAAVTADEFARSNQAFLRAFCDRCFDEVFLERRHFETQVELNKTIYQQEGKRLISVFPDDLRWLDVLLASKLRLFGFVLERWNAGAKKLRR